MQAERALELVLPWPSKDLSPNARLHWSKKAAATAMARQTGALLALQAGWKGISLPPGRLFLWLDFYQQPHKALPDDDNMLRRFKPYRDGIAQVLGVDDKVFITRHMVHEERRKGGQVVVRITGAAQINDQLGNEDGKRP